MSEKMGAGQDAYVQIFTIWLPFLIPKETINGRQCLCDGKEPVSKFGMLIARWLLPTHLPSLNICLLVGKKGIKHLIKTRLRSNVIQCVDKRSSL